MKKYAVILGCVFSAMLLLTGCNKKAEVEANVQERVNSNVPEVVEMVVGEAAKVDVSTLGDITVLDDSSMLTMDYDEWTKDQNAKFEADEPLKLKNQNTLKNAIVSYKKCAKDSGELITDSVANIEVAESKEGFEVVATFNATGRTGKMSISYDENMTITNIAFNPDYSIAENMSKAGLNTLMGMGTVFAVLILISLIISLFGLIPKIQKSMAEKKETKSDIQNTSVDNTIAQIVEKEETELSDDLELVAVISAAIAAYEGSATTEGFVVRSIKKSNKWQNAQF